MKNNSDIVVAFSLTTWRVNPKYRKGINSLVFWILKNLENSIILCNTPNEIAFIIYSKLNL